MCFNGERKGAGLSRLIKYGAAHIHRWGQKILVECCIYRAEGFVQESQRKIKGHTSINVKETLQNVKVAYKTLYTSNIH